MFKKILIYVLPALLIPGLIGAATVLWPYQGGTGTSSSPGANQILIGDGTGKYTVGNINNYASPVGVAGAWMLSSMSNVLTPTNTSAGIFVNASSTFDSNLRVNGNATTTGNLMANNIFYIKDGEVGINTSTNLTALLNIEPPEGRNGIKMYSYGKDDDGEILVLQNTNTSTKSIITFKDYTGDSKAWLVMHEYSSAGILHNHFSIETADVSGQLQTRLGFPYGCDYDCQLQINQSNLVLTRNTGQTNGNMYIGGNFGHNGNFSFYPNYANNASYGFAIATSGNSVLIRAIGQNELQVDDNLKVNGNATSSNLWLGTGGTTNSINNAGGDLYVQNDVEVDGTFYMGGGDITLIGSTADIAGDNPIDIYPENQTSIGFRIDQDTTNLEFSALGSNYIEMNDNLIINGVAGQPAFTVASSTASNLFQLTATGDLLMNTASTTLIGDFRIDGNLQVTATTTISYDLNVTGGDMPRLRIGGQAVQQRWIKPYHTGIAITSQTMTTDRFIYAEFESLTGGWVDQICYIVGATQNGNVTLLIYGPVVTEETIIGASKLIESASTAQGSINSSQCINVTATYLTPGRYYVGLQGDNSIGTYMRQSNQTQVSGWGGYDDHVYGSLPATATTTIVTGSAIPALHVRLQVN